MRGESKAKRRHARRKIAYSDGGITPSCARPARGSASLEPAQPRAASARRSRSGRLGPWTSSTCAPSSPWLGSITKTAEALHLTQPAVSGQIKSLEEALDVKLLLRTPTALTLTGAGQDLKLRAEKVIDAFGEFVNAAVAARRRGRQLRIGLAMYDPAVMRVGALMQRLACDYPVCGSTCRSGGSAGSTTRCASRKSTRPSRSAETACPASPKCP